jgi:hypothetical protein
MTRGRCGCTSTVKSSSGTILVVFSWMPARYILECIPSWLTGCLSELGFAPCLLLCLFSASPHLVLIASSLPQLFLSSRSVSCYGRPCKAKRVLTLASLSRRTRSRFFFVCLSHHCLLFLTSLLRQARLDLDSFQSVPLELFFLPIIIIIVSFFPTSNIRFSPNLEEAHSQHVLKVFNTISHQVSLDSTVTGHGDILMYL